MLGLACDAGDADISAFHAMLGAILALRISLSSIVSTVEVVWWMVQLYSKNFVDSLGSPSPSEELVRSRSRTGIRTPYIHRLSRRYLLQESYILIYKPVVVALIALQYIGVGRTGVNAYSIRIKQ